MSVDGPGRLNLLGPLSALEALVDHANDGCSARPYRTDSSQHHNRVGAPVSFVDDDNDDDHEADAGKIYNNCVSDGDDDDDLLSQAT